MKTTAVLSTFLLAMVIHPDVCRAAQAEMDAVIGPDRFPTLEDRNLLPYLECVLKETYRCAPPIPSQQQISNWVTIERWNPAAPLGICCGSDKKT